MPGLIGQHINTAFVGNPPLGSSTLIFDNSGNLTIKRSDGSTELVVGTSSGTQSIISGFTINNITYNQLITGLSFSSLTASYYKITDFQTRGWILGSTDSASYSGIVEPLIVFAASGSLYPQAKSDAYPQDEILYDPHIQNWLDDRSFSKDGVNIIPDFKGVIYNRKDVERNIETSFDFRNVLIRRWKLDETSMGLTSWGAGTWSRDDIVEDSNGAIYYCLETHYTDGLTGTSSFNPNEYYATTSTANYQLIRNNTYYHWLRLFKKDLYLLPAWQLGTMSMTYSLGFGVFPESLSTPRVLNLTIDMNSYQDFNVFGIHGTTSLKSDVYDLTMTYPLEESKQQFGSIVLTNRIESNKKIYNVNLKGTNLTLYDMVPIIPGSIFASSNDILIDIDFENFQRILVYGDEYVTTENPDIIPSFSQNKTVYNIDIFGYTQLCNIFTSTIYPSLIENSILVNGFSLLTSFRGCQAFNISRTSLISNFKRVINTNMINSQSSIINNMNRCDVSTIENCIFEHNFVDDTIYSNNSEIGPGFEENVIGPGGIIDSVIGSSFKYNYFYGIYESSISSDILGLTGSTTLSLQNVTIEPDSISNQDISLATHIYADYNTTIYKRPDGSSRLRYWDNLDTIQIVSATA